MMNKVKWIILFTGILLLGVLASSLSVVPLLAAITLAVAAAILLMDYEKATLVVALYTALEFLLRSVLGRPISQILSLFGKNAYFNFVADKTASSLAISSYWDELAMLACFGIWFYKWLRYRQEKPLRKTPLDVSLILFMAVGLVLLFAAAPSMTIGIEGLRVVIQYMLWFFVVTQLLRSPEGAKRLLNILVFSGLLVGLYGVYQFVIAVNVPSNWTDANESYVRTRVFSIFTSSNMLGGYLTLLIPIAVGLFVSEKERMRKVYYAAAIAIMGMCLLFTMARQGWIACCVGFVVFIWYKNKKLLLPAILGIAALVVFCMFFVPSVSSRILYLLSPEYVASSMRGGRLIRWSEALQLFKQHFWTGMGLGQYGGSVALSHKLNNSPSMDNYYLKTALEMGIFGLTALLMLIYNIVAWCSRAVKKISDGAQKDWVCGIIAGLVGVILYNFTENMLEIPLISSYFWMCAGIVMFLAYGQDNVHRSATGTGPLAYFNHGDRSLG
jgi:O-antigen ligase